MTNYLLNDEVYGDCKEGSISGQNRGKRFSGKRFQQLWFAVKRFSPIHRPHSRKLSINTCDSDQDYNGRPTWSPFIKRRNPDKKRYRLYSSHPDISSNKLHDTFVQDSLEIDVDRKRDIKYSPNRSPLNRIKKIKRDMQRCVQKIPSSDYELNHIDANNHEVSDTHPVDAPTGPRGSAEEPETATTSPKFFLSNMLQQSSLSGRFGKLRREKTIDSTNEPPDIEEDIINVNYCSTQPEGTKSSTGSVVEDVDRGKMDKVKARMIKLFIKLLFSQISSGPDRDRIHKLLQYPFFQVDIHLRNAQNLLAKDACGKVSIVIK